MLRLGLASALFSLSAPVLAGAQALDPSELTALDFRAPVHRGAEPDSTALWAAGHDYKVRFDADSITFVPVLGSAAPRSLPLVWRTCAPDGSRVERTHGDWHVEFHRGALVERYDVLPHGLEQSFVLREKPGGLADVFELRGRVDSALHAALRLPQHAPLVFSDEQGDPVVSFGAGFAFDAAGARIAIDTAFDGEEIALRVPGSWLAAATYPVTIDPLLSRTTLQGGSVSVSSTATARGSLAAYPYTERVLVAATRAVSASEGDLYAWVLDQDLANPALVVSRLDFNVAVTGVRATFSSSLLRFALAAQRGTGTVIVRTHPFDSAALNFGGEASSAIATPSFVLSGGNDPRVLLAWTANQTSIVGRAFELLDTPVLRSTFGIGPAGSRRDPVACAQPNGGWIVALQVQNAAGVWKAGACRIYTNLSQTTFAPDLGLPQDARHELQLQIDGDESGYELSFGLDDDPYATRVDELHVRRFRWNTSEVQPVAGSIRQVAPSSGTWSYRNDALAVDPFTESLWAAGYTRTHRASGANTYFVERLGTTGGSVEIAGIYSDNLGSTPHRIAGLSLGRAVRSRANPLRTPHFPLAFGTSESSRPLYVQRFAHGDARVVDLGGGCGGYVGAAAPHAGRSAQWLTLDGAQTPLPAFLLLGASPLAIPLDGLGAPGCLLGVDPLVTLGFAPTGGSGYVYTSFALPDAPAVRGDIYAQWAWLESGAHANVLGARLSDTLRLEIR
ncbi:MAG: hypothetical protein IPN34_24240 [Planctomycetes bacterium]|nr:hypothetical protein [Planctomycetota bacterium]